MRLSRNERTLLLYAAGEADAADVWIGVHRCGGGSVPSELAVEGLRSKGLVTVHADGSIEAAEAGRKLARNLRGRDG